MMGERYGDFWKILKNYVENYQVIESYKEFILFIIVQIILGILFIGWNVVGLIKRMKILDQIVQKKVIEMIELFVNKIFNFMSDYIRINF